VCPRTSAPRSGIGPPRCRRAHGRSLRGGDGRASSPGPTTWWANASDAVHPLVRERLASRWTAGSSPELERDDSGGWASARARSTTEPLGQLELAGERPPARAQPRSPRARGAEDRPQPRPVHRRLPPTTGAATRAELLGDERGLALRVSRAAARGERGAFSTSTASRSSARSPVHRPGLRRGRVLREHRRRPRRRCGQSRSSSSATAGRWGDASLAGFGAFLAAHRGPTARTTSRATAASPASCRRSWGRADSRDTPGRAARRRGLAARLQMMAAREKPGSSQGLYVAPGAGHNAQSQQPTTTLATSSCTPDGMPVLVDVEWSSTRRSFQAPGATRSGRCSRLAQLPAVNRLDQGAGAEFRAHQVAFAPGRGRRALLPSTSRWRTRRRRRSREGRHEWSRTGSRASPEHVVSARTTSRFFDRASTSRRQPRDLRLLRVRQREVEGEAHGVAPGSGTPPGGLGTPPRPPGPSLFTAGRFVPGRLHRQIS